MNGGALLIRADASAAIGTGHAMRCLALAQAWQDSGRNVVFAMAESAEAVRQRLLSESCEVVAVTAEPGSPEDSRQITALASERQAAWVVVDGYQFGAEYQRALKMAGFRVLLLDDYGHATHYSADLVLNQNVCARPALYANREPWTRLLLGPRYCLLRREFRLRHERKRETLPTARRVLVTMGGSDPENLTERAIEALELVRVEGLEAIVVVGGSNPRSELLRQRGARCDRSGLKVTVQADVTAIPELMAWADVAISAAGSTCWELCFMGLPSLLIDAAENQTALAQELDRLGCAIHLGSARDVSPANIAEQLHVLLGAEELRRSRSRSCRQLVDGEGTGRVATILSQRLQLRRARTEDARLLWEWANDPNVRSNSFASEPILWETHVRWLAEKLGQNGSLLLIAEDGSGEPVGQIRFDASDRGEAYVNLSIAEQHRSRGLATLLIQLGVQEAFAGADCRRIHALVKEENIPSVRAFESSGFVRAGVEEVRGSPAIRFICDKK